MRTHLPLSSTAAVIALCLLSVHSHSAFAEMPVACQTVLDQWRDQEKPAAETTGACVAVLPEASAEEQTRFMRAYQRQFGRILGREEIEKLAEDLTPDATRMLMAKSAPYLYGRIDPTANDELAQLISEAESVEDTMSLAHLHYASAEQLLRSGGDTAEMESQLRKSLGFAERHELASLMPAILNGLAVRAKVDGDYAVAVEHYREAMTAYENVGVYAGVGVVQSNIANIFSDLNDHQTAIEYYKKTLAIYDEHIPENYDIIAISKINMGTAHSRLGEYQQAVQVFDDARITNAKAASRRLDGLLNFRHAKALFEVGDKDEAVEMAESSVPQTLELRDPAEAAVALNWLAERYLERGDNAAARSALERAREIIEPEGEGAEALLANPGNTSWALEYAREMGILLNRLGEPDAAAPYYEAALTLGEDRFETEKMQAMANADLLFQLRDNETAIELMKQNALLADLSLRQSQLRSWIGVLVALLASVAAFTIYRSYQGQRRLAIAKDTFLKETHHRTKNNLQLLSSLLRLNASRQSEETSLHEKSVDLADRARMMALVNDHLYAFGDEPTATVSAKPFLNDLLDLLQNSLGRQGVTINSDVVDINLDADKVIPIGLIVSETITNSYKYAFGPSGGDISVRLEHSDAGHLSLTVSDTGQGFDMEEVKRRKSGLGVSIVEDLASQLFATVNTASGADGTQWQFRIPLDTSEAIRA